MRRLAEQPALRVAPFTATAVRVAALDWRGEVARQGKVVFVTGKGGTGKTTVAAALATSFAAAGGRTVLVGLDGLADLPGLPEELRFERVDPNKALLEWLTELGGRVAARLLIARSSFRLFAAAAPGARELLTLSRIAELRHRYDFVVVDGPASGHARALWRSPATVAGIARVGPIAERTRELGLLLADDLAVAFVAVAKPLELAVSETVELASLLEADLGRRFTAVVLNCATKQRFTKVELATAAEAKDAVVAEAVVAARRSTARYHRERREAARLRRAGLRIVELPLVPNHGELIDLALELQPQLAPLTRSLAG